MKTITKEFAKEVKENKSIEKSGFVYEYCPDNGEILWFNQNHQGMMDWFGYCEVED